MIYLGIDPGAKGGAVAINVGESGNAYLIECHKWSEDLSENVEFLRERDVARCVIEKVGAMPGQGVTSMFSFGRNFGQWEATIISVAMRHQYAAPQTWMKALNVGTKKAHGGTTAQWKTHLAAIAKRLYPTLAKDVPKDLADALLMAHYARQLRWDV